VSRAAAASPAAAAVATLSETERGLSLGGSWTLPGLAALAERAARLRPDAPAGFVETGGLTGLDTAGALLLLRILGRGGHRLADHRIEGLRPEHRRLLELVNSSLASAGTGANEGTMAASTGRARRAALHLLSRAGDRVMALLAQTRELLGFVGLALQSLGALLIGRKKLRLTATVFHMEQVGLDAVPIVSLLSFLVGAVVAFLGATVLRDFGASIYTVELVGYSFLREFGVLLTAILLAGRSGSAFTAQIGSMMSREEIDAIQTLGLDVMELLVLPRLLALLVVLPLLTFIAMLSGIIGGALVGAFSLDITLGMFWSRLHETTQLRHFMVGLSKAPVFALIIAVVGCLEGLKVEGSAESVGRRTTSSVVQAIFLVIVFDALFAIWFMEMGV
jgi:phospholipid/cholesterol/gamma-HCH transport system permease protein